MSLLELGKLNALLDTAPTTMLANSFLPEGSYSVQLTLTNWFGQSSSATHALTKSATPLPKVQLAGSARRKTSRKQGLNISVATTAATCGDGTSDNPLSHTWTQAIPTQNPKSPKPSSQPRFQIAPQTKHRHRHNQRRHRQETSPPGHDAQHDGGLGPPDWVPHRGACDPGRCPSSVPHLPVPTQRDAGQRQHGARNHCCGGDVHTHALRHMI